MKQALATGQKLVFGGEICNLGAKKQREEKEKTASHAHKAQDRRLLDIQKKKLSLQFLCLIPQFIHLSKSHLTQRFSLFFCTFFYVRETVVKFLICKF